MAKQHSPEFLRVSMEAKARVHERDVHVVKAMLDLQKDFILLDVREDHEWEKGHLPQAKHLCKGIIERDIEKQIPDKNTQLVLYCGGGFRSALAGDSLQKMGYTQVVSMDGGFSGWKAAGYPIETEESK